MNSSINLSMFILLGMLSIVGWHFGFVQKLYAADATNIVYLITAFFLGGQVFIWWGKHAVVKRLASIMVLLGLVGTVVGFFMSFNGIDLSSEEAPEQLVAGIGSALSTTILSSVGLFWIWLNQVVLGHLEE